MSNCLIAYFSCAYDWSGESWKRIKFNNGKIVTHIVGDMNMPLSDIKTVVMDQVHPYIDPSIEWEDWATFGYPSAIKGIIKESGNTQSFFVCSNSPTHTAGKRTYKIEGKVGDCSFQIIMDRIYFHEKGCRLTKVA